MTAAERAWYCGMGSCGVMSTRGSAMRPLWLASISELRGMAVAASFICALSRRIRQVYESTGTYLRASACICSLSCQSLQEPLAGAR